MELQGNKQEKKQEKEAVFIIEYLHDINLRLAVPFLVGGKSGKRFATSFSLSLQSCMFPGSDHIHH